jgi:hypothetical protein
MFEPLKAQAKIHTQFQEQIQAVFKRKLTAIVSDVTDKIQVPLIKTKIYCNEKSVSAESLY